MLTKFDIVSPRGDTLTLTLDDISQGYIVQNIDGLDPVKASLTSSTFATRDGAQFQASRLEPRNITMTLGLEPDPATGNDVRWQRKNLYSYVMPKSAVTLRFYTDTTGPGSIVEIQAIVESVETALFSQEPTLDISFMCYDPAFVDPTVVVETGSDMMTDLTWHTFHVDGDAGSGAIITINVNRSVSEFSIYYWPPGGSIYSMDLQGSFIAGDVITVNSYPGSKGVTLTRAGTTTSALSMLTPQSTWFEISQGNNNMQIQASGAGIPWQFQYSNRYGGL